jgi:hypothetical protein
MFVRRAELDNFKESHLMADREPSHSSGPERDDKRQQGMVEARHDGGHHDKQGRARVKPVGTVGREVLDQSKEHNTEIAVEAGRHDPARREQK